MITPVKAAIGAPYKKIESLLQEAVHIRFGLPPELPSGIAHSIKRADRMAAYLEATELAGFSAKDAGKLFHKLRGTPKGIDLTPLSPEKATRSFLRRFDVLFGRNGPAR